MKKKSNQVVVLLHNIRSVHNVGSIFRTSDALGVSKIYLSGFSPTPTDKFNRSRKDMAKVALGAEENVKWEYVKDPVKLIKKFSSQGGQVVGIEQSDKSVDYKKITLRHGSGQETKVLFIVGNEVGGIDGELLELCDTIAEIPMVGKKESLNVSVAFGVALFRMLGV